MSFVVRQGGVSLEIYTTFYAKQFNRRSCAKKVNEEGTSANFRKDIKSGGSDGTKISKPYGKLFHRSVHPKTHIFPTKKGQIATPTSSMSSLNPVSRLSIEKNLYSREICKDLRPGPSKEVILYDLDDIIERNAKDEIVEKCVNTSHHSNTSDGNQKNFYQAPSIFYIQNKGGDACNSVKFQDNDMAVILPNQVEY